MTNPTAHEASEEKNMSEYYFKQGVIYDTSKFTESDWLKWWIDKAVLDYNHCRWELDEKGNKERNLDRVCRELYCRIIDLQIELHRKHEN